IDATQAAGFNSGKPPRGLDGRRGDVLARLGRYDEAAEALRREIASYPKDLQHYANLAIVKALAGRRDEVGGILADMAAVRPPARSRPLAAPAQAFRDAPPPARA